MIDTAYYDEEMAYLREAGRAFANHHPQRASSLRLDSPESADPHVERLIESFAFLSARIRQRLDEDFPELCATLLSLVSPTLVAPTPAVTMLQFQPTPLILGRTRIPSGAEVESLPATEEETRCRFRTTAPVDVYPLTMVDVGEGRTPGRSPFIRVTLKLLEGVDSQALDCPRIRFLVDGDLPVRSPLYALLHSDVAGVRVSIPAGEDRKEFSRRLDARHFRTAPFNRQEALFPQPDHTFGAFRLLHEYFTFPEGFRFFDLSGLEFLSEWPSFTDLYIDLELDGEIPPGLRLGPKNLRLFCVPAVNLFADDGVPVATDLSASEYRLESTDLGAPSKYEIYCVDRVVKFDVRTGVERVLPPFYGFLPRATSAGEDDALAYQMIRRRGPAGGAECWIRFISPRGSWERPSPDVLSVEMTCSNGEVANVLRLGDVCVRGEGVPESVTVTNLTHPTPSLPAPLSAGRDQRYWLLLGHVSANLLSMLNTDVFRGTLELLAGHAGLSLSPQSTQRGNHRRSEIWRRRLASIQEVTTEPAEEIVEGCVVRGIRVRVSVANESDFEERGELLQFMHVLSQFFSHYVAINAFVELRLQCRRPSYEEVWPWCSGNRPLL